MQAEKKIRISSPDSPLLLSPLLDLGDIPLSPDMVPFHSFSLVSCPWNCCRQTTSASLALPGWLPSLWNFWFPTSMLPKWQISLLLVSNVESNSLPLGDRLPHGWCRIFMIDTGNSNVSIALLKGRTTVPVRRQ